MPDVPGAGVIGFAIESQSDGPTAIAVFLAADGGPVFSFSSSGTDDALGDVVAIADEFRPASPGEDALFVEP